MGDSLTYPILFIVVHQLPIYTQLLCISSARTAISVHQRIGTGADRYWGCVSAGGSPMTLQFCHYSECNIVENEAVFSFTYDTNLQKTGLALDFQVCITSFNLQFMTTQ